MGRENQMPRRDENSGVEAEVRKDSMRKKFRWVETQTQSPELVEGSTIWRAKLRRVLIFNSRIHKHHFSGEVETMTEDMIVCADIT